jgi:hypothetical protein
MQAKPDQSAPNRDSSDFVVALVDAGVRQCRYADVAVATKYAAV